MHPHVSRRSRSSIIIDMSRLGVQLKVQMLPTEAMGILIDACMMKALYDYDNAKLRELHRQLLLKRCRLDLFQKKNHSVRLVN